MILHHLGIVVEHLERAIPVYETWMGAVRIGGIVEDEYQRARIQLFALSPEILLELIEPLPGHVGDPHDPGTYHLCYTVPNLDAETARLAALGAVVAYPTGAAVLFGEHRLAFLATDSGQLLELLEHPETPVV